MAGEPEIIRSFEPVQAADSRVLILGSMPGAESLRQGRYYAFARNAFWKIMAELLGFDVALDYPSRCRKLIEAKIALWDVCKCCVRLGSLDSNISGEQPNDLQIFFTNHKHLEAVFFNGQAAHRLFMKHVHKKYQAICSNTELHSLPSTSPANASMNFAQKLDKWRVIKDYLK